jgi:hypothetical protein
MINSTTSLIKLIEMLLDTVEFRNNFKDYIISRNIHCLNTFRNFYVGNNYFYIFINYKMK